MGKHRACKCGHGVENHKHYSDSTKCSAIISEDAEGKSVYCLCKGPRPYWRFLSYWL